MADAEQQYMETSENGNGEEMNGAEEQSGSDGLAGGEATAQDDPHIGDGGQIDASKVEEDSG